MKILHHGAVDGVTGSCHQLFWNDGRDSLLVDCGLFQGDEASRAGGAENDPVIRFDISTVRALLVTHCHIDHVGRIPYLMAAGFDGKIYCTEPTARLLPAVLEDAVKIGFTRDRAMVSRFIRMLEARIIAVPYGERRSLPGTETGGSAAAPLSFRFKPAGHILGSAYVECRVRDGGTGRKPKKVLFSGDLGAPYAPLLPAPKAPWSADILVIEATYGDRNHEGRRDRQVRLKQIAERCFRNRGTLLIPAFSIGRTQELLYELEQIIHRFGKQEAAGGLPWEMVDIIVDSPLAARFTGLYRELQPHWDREAKRRVRSGRHPLAFEQLTTVETHEKHLWTVDYLRRSGRPAVVIAASGMCTGGRVVNYLKALIEEEPSDILFVGYQAAGTPGRAIQTYGPRGGWVELDGKRHTIRAGVHTIGGYSAHADQAGLVRFVKGMRRGPDEVRLVHGETGAKKALRTVLRRECPDAEVVIP